MLDDALSTGELSSEWSNDVDRRVWLAFDVGVARKFFRGGSTVVVATGWQAGSGHTNTVRVVTVPVQRPLDIPQTPAGALPLSASSVALFQQEHPHGPDAGAGVDDNNDNPRITVGFF